MAVTEQGPGGGAFQRRIKNILFTPAEEWDRIDAEPATVRGLFLGYACILAAIGPVARLIGELMFGLPGAFLRARPPLIPALVGAILGYGLSLAGVFVLGLVIDLLAPSFGGTRSPIQALKAAVYSSTAAWIFAVFQIVPQVSGLSIIGIYSLYLLYLGIPKLMKSPGDKALIYSILTIAVAMAIWIVTTLVAGAMVMAA